MAKSYRTSFIETSGGESMSAHKIFCTWDYRISNDKAAEMTKRSIYNELKLILGNVYDSVEVPSKWTSFWMLVTQISANVFVLAILCGVGYFIWTLLHVRKHCMRPHPLDIRRDMVMRSMNFFVSDDDKYGIEFEFDCADDSGADNVGTSNVIRMAGDVSIVFRLWVSSNRINSNPNSSLFLQNGIVQITACDLKHITDTKLFTRNCNHLFAAGVLAIEEQKRSKYQNLSNA